MKLTKLKGLYIPIITPMLKANFDKESMRAVFDSVDEYINGYIPCLSSGEGADLNNSQWKEVVVCLRSYTDKPVIPGIKRNNINSALELVKVAEELSCDGIAITVPSNNFNETFDYFSRIAAETDLPILVYNTEDKHISTKYELLKLDSIQNVVGLKDSSMNQSFFELACQLREEGTLRMSILQGMEHLLNVPNGCDGYLVSLLNIEPKLVFDYFNNKTDDLHQKIIDIFWTYNLGGEWFVTLKAVLFMRNVIRSAEQVNLAIKL